MNLILIGYRATGKSTVSRRLAQRLGLPRIELDAQIVSRASQSIVELVKAQGWDHFRDLEERVVSDACRGQGQVIDCGGGVVEREANIQRLRGAGTVFWLHASPESIATRLGTSNDRPALTANHTPISEIREVLARREPLYRRLAHVKLTTDQSTPAELVERILSLWPGL